MPHKDREKRLAYLREYGKRKRRERPEGVRAYHRQYYSEHHQSIKDRRREYQRRYARQHGRAHRLDQKYGLTVEQWEVLFESQNRRCACCGTTEPHPSWHTDHDHQTNQIRGILCNGCNTGIGKLGDSLEGVRKAIEYLERAYRRNEADRVAGAAKESANR